MFCFLSCKLLIYLLLENCFVDLNLDFFICMYLPLCHLTTKLLKLKVWKLEIRLVTHTYTFKLLCINV